MVRPHPGTAYSAGAPGPGPDEGSVGSGPGLASAAHAPISTGPALRVLVVEDDPADAARLRRMLAASPAAVFREEHVERIEEALEALASRAADVVLLDLGLADSDGLESCERLHHAGVTAPLVVLTGLDDEEIGREAVRRGAQDFLVKATTGPEVLGRSLLYAVERHRLLAEVERTAQEARSGEANVRALLEHSVEALVVVDPGETVRYANRAAETLLGIPVRTLVGAEWPVVWAAATGSVVPAPRDGPTPPEEVALLRPGLASSPAEIRISTIAWAGQDCHLISMIDLSDRKRTERVALARSVQRSFLPERREAQSGSLLAAGANELCEDVSGDFYDFVPLPDGRIAVAVGDVTGHGLGAALLMAQGRAFLRACVREGHDVATILAGMNDALLDTPCEGRFLTLFLGIADPSTGVLEWANAGHVPALLLRAESGRSERLGATGHPLWVLPGARIPAGTPTHLDEGDVLLVCSDGVTEAKSIGGDLYGLGRLGSALTLYGHHAPDRLIASLRGELRIWTGPGPLQDDLTLVALARRAAEAPRSRGDSVS